MDGVINIITDIKIEYAPDPEEALKDKTSFDVFIVYSMLQENQVFLVLK